MDDLEQLRRHVWVAMMAVSVACTGEDASTTKTEAPKRPASAVEADATKKPAKEKTSGMIGVVLDVKADVEHQAELDRIEAAKPTVDAETVCEIALDKADAQTGKLGTSEDELGCPLRTSGGPGGKYYGLRLSVPKTQTLRDGRDTEHCCYQRLRPPTRGRPYRVDGAERLPDFMVGPRRPGARAADLRAAAGWLHDAREELASVAAFHRAALELTTHGAPRSLIDSCHRAAEQERRHATLCLSIAESVAGRPLRLSRAPAVRAREVGLLQLLLHTFEEGCVGESIAAVVASRSARDASPRIRAALLEIATDEAEHATLAWQTLAWGLPRLSVPDRRRFLTAATSAIDQDTDENPDGHSTASDGRLPTSVQSRICAQVSQRVIKPLLNDLAAVILPPRASEHHRRHPARAP